MLASSAGWFGSAGAVCAVAGANASHNPAKVQRNGFIIKP
jgi:hypothetical protein